MSDIKPPTSLIARLLVGSPASPHISRLAKILSTSAGIDTTLLLVGYTLTLIQAQLARLINFRLEVLAQKVATNASKSISPGETIVATLSLPTPTSQLADIQVGMKTFAGMCADVRAFMRLWGLLAIYNWARTVATAGPTDKLLRLIAWGQVTANASYLVLEHGAYLAGKGVLRGWTPQQIARNWRWAGRCFAGHIILDFIRLYRVQQLRKRKNTDGEVIETEKDDKLTAREDWLWWKSLYVDTAYSPLCVHWSVEGGFVNESWYGALGMVSGILGFREAWRQAAV